IIIPVAALFALHIDHFSSPSASQSVFSILNTASLLTFWGFIGIETATTAGGIVDKPTKTIPRAVIFGTLIVAGIYFFNSFSIMGVVHPSQLANSAAPYVDAADVLFGPWGNVAIAIVAFVACVGTLNAWVLTSGQIAVQAAKDRLFPDFFAKSNKGGAPYASLLIAFFCTLILLVFTLHADLLSEINMVIDVSVTTFIFIYLASALALIKILRYKEHVHSIKPFIIPSLSVLFCLWILLFTPLRALLLSLLFTLSGLPVYLIQRRRIQRSLLQKD
ncbi:MAG: amino acid permease, partial [Chlamydiae bacterium]|nr:amino acid permease [Chlamydiota bacterium]